MKNLTSIQKERVRLFKATLNVNSKWYNQDLQDFIDKVAKESKSDSERVIGRVNYMNSDKYEKEIKIEIYHGALGR